jgi:hypothetical protein
MCYGLCLCLLCAVVPPGHYYNGTVTLKCPSGSYRADWKPATDATVGSCISCGVGVQASLTDQIKVYNDSLGGVIYWFEPVTTSADDCCKYHAALHWLHPIPTFLNCSPGNTCLSIFRSCPQAFLLGSLGSLALIG